MPSVLVELQEILENHHQTLSLLAKLEIFLKQLAAVGSSTTVEGSASPIVPQQEVDSAEVMQDRRPKAQPRHHPLTLNVCRGITQEIIAPYVQPHRDLGETVRELQRALDTAIAAAPAAGASTLADLPSNVSAVVVSQLFLCGREAEGLIKMKSKRLKEEMRGRMSSVDVSASMTHLVTQELDRLAQFPKLTTIRLVGQAFTVEQQATLAALLSSRPTLQFVDLTGCLLRDGFVRNTLIPCVGALNELSVLLLGHNALTDVAATAVLELLRNPRQSHSLQILDVDTGNDVSVELQREIRKALRERHATFLPLPAPPSTAQAPADHPIPKFAQLGVSTLRRDALESDGKRRVDAPVRVACFDGGAMMCVAEALLAHQVQEAFNLATRATIESGLLPDWTNVDLFVGSSFGAIVAAALAFGKPLEDLQRFFQHLAERVFVQGHYTYYLQAAGRMMRDWWTGGNYYSAAILKEELELLFGPWTSFKLPDDRKADLILLAATGIGKEPSDDASLNQPIVFRSYQPSAQNLKLVDVLMACCAVRGFFAPAALALPLKGGGSTQVKCVEYEFEPNPSTFAVMEVLRYVPAHRLQLLSVSSAMQNRSILRPLEVDAPSSSASAATRPVPVMDILLLTQITKRGIEMAASGKQPATAGLGLESATALRELQCAAMSDFVASSVATALRTVDVLYTQPLDAGATEAETGPRCVPYFLPRYRRFALRSDLRVRMDEDNLFLLNELLPDEVTKAWIQERHSVKGPFAGQRKPNA